VGGFLFGLTFLVLGITLGLRWVSDAVEYRDDPKRDTGSWDQTVGSAKESVGNLIGNENLRRTTWRWCGRLPFWPHLPRAWHHPWPEMG
jgi:hypothetical protein